jgi:enoyl-CoA hydratase
MKHLRLEVDNGLATVVIAREKALNALNAEVLAELTSLLSEIENDDRVRVVALTGAGGKAFVAGADIAEMKDLSTTQAYAFAQAGGRVAEAIESSSRPYVAQVDGFALGGGCELALACDFIYASKRSNFGQPEVKLGVVPGFGGTQRLLRRVGVAKAKELIFSGDMVPADEALRIGLCDQVFSPEELPSGVRKLADRIIKNGPLAVAESKRLIDDGQSMGLRHGLELERKSFAGLFGSSDQTEGMAAFLEKRTANFKGE